MQKKDLRNRKVNKLKDSKLEMCYYYFIVGHHIYHAYMIICMHVRMGNSSSMNKIMGWQLVDRYICKGQDCSEMFQKRALEVLGPWDTAKSLES